MLPPSSFVPFLDYHAGFLGESYFLPPLKTTPLIKTPALESTPSSANSGYTETIFSLSDTLQIAVVIGRFVFLVFFA